MSDIVLKHFSLYKIPLFILNSIFVASSAIGGGISWPREEKCSGEKNKCLNLFMVAILYLINSLYSERVKQAAV